MSTPQGKADAATAKKNQNKSMPIKPDFSGSFDDVAYGCVDTIDQNGVTGWYISEAEDPPLLQISYGDLVIGHTRPNMLRQDISAVAGRPSHSGFLFRWQDLATNIPLQLTGEDAHFTEVTVKCLKTNRPLHSLNSQDDIRERLLEWIRPYSQRHPTTEQFKNGGGPVLCSENLNSASPPCVDIKISGLNSAKLHGLLSWDQNNGINPSTVQLAIYVDKILIEKFDVNPRKGASSEVITRGFSWLVPEKFLNGDEHILEIRATASRRTTVSRAFKLGKGNFDAELTYMGAGRLDGFCAERTIVQERVSVELLIDGEDVFPIAESEKSHTKKGAFSFYLPNKYLDGAPHTVELLCNGKSICSIFAVCDIRGHIDVLNGNELVGWAYDAASENPLELVVIVDGSELPYVIASASRQDVGRPSGFRVELSSLTKGKSSFDITIALRHGKAPILRTPKTFFRMDGLIETIRKIMSADGETKLFESEKLALSKYLGPRLIDILRQEVGQSVFLMKPNDAISEKVKVIVPVYDGVDETIRCLVALFQSKAANETKFDVVLINDQGPNPAITPLLEKISERNDVTLLVNERNMGFVLSVNRALRITAGYDVVLLNADAVVNGNWLDRIRNIAYKNSTIASVTPFSNNATICSYPDLELENSMPQEISLSEIDQLCSKLNHAQAVEIPSGVGFCMYMKAAAIAEVGLLDAQKFGMGYAEENDWCIRARDLGWKHMHACDTFVEHIGGVSFGKDKKNSLVEKNLVILGNTYPEYTPVVMDFIQADPARMFRNRITVERIRRALNKFAEAHLYISHSFGGGIEVFCNNRANELANDNIAILKLESVGADKVRLLYEDYTAIYRLTEWVGELVPALKQLSPQRVHINSDIGHGTNVWSIHEILQIPLDVTIHDYTVVCPRVNFMTSNHTYCGEPKDSQTCNSCIENEGTYAYLNTRWRELGGTTSRWRDFYSSQLKLAENVYVPDQDVAQRLSKYFPDIKITVNPHSYIGEIPNITMPSISKGEVMRVAVIGAIGPHKGYDMLHACIAEASQKSLPLHFFVAGYTCNDDKLLKYKNVSITGKFEQEDLPDVLEELDCHVALFLSPWPETYSYTLTEALLSGLWPIVLPIGAQASRIRDANYGTILPENATARGVIETLLSLAT